uniref:Insulin-like domain-containing protein n=1 Tax=Cyprinus carpio TaxID=7962 RepID=A0A8C1YQL4_CYPCA
MLCVKMFGVFSALLLVCVWGVCVRGSADLPRDFGVKLCGREFIRAVIFTCGGSRWRRSGPQPVCTYTSSSSSSILTRETGDRRTRNFSLGLAGMCCNQGCTKTDIGLLC